VELNRPDFLNVQVQQPDLALADWLRSWVICSGSAE
jgi:hypothetical protein